MFTIKYIFPVVYGTLTKTLTKNKVCVIPIAIDDGYKQADVLDKHEILNKLLGCII